MRVTRGIGARLTVTVPTVRVGREPQPIPDAVGRELLAAQKAYHANPSAANKKRYDNAVNASDAAAFPPRRRR